MSREVGMTLLEKIDDATRSPLMKILELEAWRLNCDISDIQPISPLIPFDSNNEEESILADLPEDIFGRITQFLNTVDSFTMTLVCKRWKNLVYSNTSLLKSAEHAPTTHLITSTDSMDPTSDQSYDSFHYEYTVFSSGLLRWYCGVSTNVETLVLHHDLAYESLVTLLQSCPKLKNLQITQCLDCNFFRIDSGDALPPVNVRLPKLEVYLSRGCCVGDRRHRNTTKLNHDVLVFSRSLRVYSGSLTSQDLQTIEFKSSLSDILSKLIALEMTVVSPRVLEILSSIESLQLKYLRFDRLLNNRGYDEGAAERISSVAFHKLLSKLHKLEVLIVLSAPKITNATIQLLTKLEVKLSFALLDATKPRLDLNVNFDSMFMQSDHMNPAVFTAFKDMLLSKKDQQNLDLSNIHFVVDGKDLWEKLNIMVPEFTILRKEDGQQSVHVESELSNPKMRRRLGLEF
eukprot:g7612.t1